MENGTAIIITSKTYEIGTKTEIAGFPYEVYNTMPSLSLVGFARLNKNGKRIGPHATLSLSFSEIEKFTKLGSIR